MTQMVKADRTRLDTVARMQWWVLATLLAGSLLFWDMGITLGIGIGGIVIIINFALLRRIIERGFADSQGPGKILGVHYALKFVGLLAAVVLLAVFLRGVMNLVAFLIGLGTVFVAISLEGVRGLRHIE